MSDTHRFGLYVPDEDPPGDQVTTRVENVTSLSWAVSVYPDAPAPDGIPGDASNCFTGYHPPRPTCFILVTKRAHGRRGFSATYKLDSSFWLILINERYPPSPPVRRYANRWALNLGINLKNYWKVNYYRLEVDSFVCRMKFD